MHLIKAWQVFCKCKIFFSNYQTALRYFSILTLRWRYIFLFLRFRWCIPLFKVTLDDTSYSCSIYILELEKIMPPPTGCPMTTTQEGKQYLATVARGEAISLQGHKSDVKLVIKKGPKRAYLMKVRSDLSKFTSIIPDDECFISPIVEVLAPAQTSTSSFLLKIPHCLDEDDDRRKVKVRMIHENRNPAVILVPDRVECTDGILFYDVDDDFIELHTNHFCLVVCTYCDRPFHCLGRINCLFYAKFETQPQENATPQHDVEIRPYFCGVVQTMVDFRKVIFQRPQYCVVNGK